MLTAIALFLFLLAILFTAVICDGDPLWKGTAIVVFIIVACSGFGEWLLFMEYAR